MGLTTENQGDADRDFGKHNSFKMPTQTTAVFVPDVTRQSERVEHSTFHRTAPLIVTFVVSTSPCDRNSAAIRITISQSVPTKLVQRRLESVPQDLTSVVQ